MTQPALPAIVVDTDVVSYLFKRDTRADEYRPHLIGRWPVMSLMSVAELELWAELHSWGTNRRRRLRQRIASSSIH